MTKRQGSANDEAIYDNVAYRSMRDVQREPHEQKLLAMQKLELGLRFILDNLGNSNIALEDVAAHAGYSPSYFKLLFSEHFEMPFAQFVMKLRMRNAALEIQEKHYPKGIWSQYGFATAASFSKAFRREIGISPRQFYKGNYAVPDMPLRKRLNGVSISLEYTIEQAFLVCGSTAPPPQGSETYLMDALALPFTGAYPQFESMPGEQIGLWYYEPETGMEYVFGPVEERFDSISVLARHSEAKRGKRRVVVQGGRYAVFSYPRPADERAIPLMQRILSRFIFQEWVPMNRKVTNTMGFTYERFTPERVYLYLPVQSGIDNDSELHEQRWGLAQWAHHIDELISIDLTVDALASLEGYSTKNYVDIFSMYYGMTPSTYIRRRRLYLASEEMRADTLGGRRDEILAKYRFSSYEQFCLMREREFGSWSGGDAGEAGGGTGASDIRGVAGEDNSGTIGDARTNGPFIDDMGKTGAFPDLETYYESNKERVAYAVRKLPDFQIFGHSIEESYDGHHPSDLLGRVLYWFTRTFPGFGRLEECFTADGAKVFIWADASQRGSEEDSGDVEPSRYYVARVIRGSIDLHEQAVLDAVRATAGAHRETIPGGYYAMFATADNLERYSLEDAFRLLTRCAFGGWIRDNRWRADLSRRTFVVWYNERFYFLVPTIG